MFRSLYPERIKRLDRKRSRLIFFQILPMLVSLEEISIALIILERSLIVLQNDLLEFII